MFSLKSILSISLLTNFTTAHTFLPAMSTSASTINNTGTATAASTITPVAIHCDNSYCVNGTSYCHYWAGISTWNTDGPSPGEVVTTMGICKAGKARMTAA
ncbi:hypothetical protein V8C42DRAFT_329444 [Trichoderma barbatum]